MKPVTGCDVSRRRPGFTLIELLVVVAIIALLISILLPSLANAKKQARRTVCLSHMHQFSIAITGYQAEYKGRMPVQISPRNWPMGWSCNYTGDNWAAWDKYYPAGPALLFLGKYIDDPSYFFCPTNAIEDRSGWLYGDVEHTWDPRQWGRPTNFYYPFMGYCYWAGYRVERDRELDEDYDPNLVADTRNPLPDQLVWSDLILKDNGRPPHSPRAGWQLSNHLSRGLEPEGGNELLVSGSAKWHDYVEGKTKRRLRLDWVDFYFVGPVRPDLDEEGG